MVFDSHFSGNSSLATDDTRRDPRDATVRAAFYGPAASNTVLVKCARAGDKSAWNQLVDRFGPLVAAVTRRHRLHGDDAADVAQAVWFALLTNLERIRDPERIGLWLHTTTRRECLATIAKANRNKAVEADVDTFAAPDPEPAELVVKAEQASSLRTALAQIPGPCRRLLELLLVRDPPAPYRQVSEECSIAIGTIGPRRRRCLGQFRQRFFELEDRGSTT